MKKANEKSLAFFMRQIRLQHGCQNFLMRVV